MLNDLSSLDIVKVSVEGHKNGLRTYKLVYLQIRQSKQDNHVTILYLAMVKRTPKLRSEAVSFLFLVCFSILVFNLGGSAGATAVFYHINFVSSVLGVKVIAVPDAGLFLDLNNTNGVSFWPAQLKR